VDCRALRTGRWLRVGLLAAAVLAAGCGRDEAPPPLTKPGVKPPVGPPPPWAKVNRLADGETLALHPDGARAEPIERAREAGLVDVDLGDDWAPFIFSEADAPDAEPKRNPYRKTFIDLANDRVDSDDVFLAGGQTRAIDLSPEAEERRRQEAEDRRLGKPPKPEPPKRKRREPVRNYLEVFGIPPTLSVLLRRMDEDAHKPCFAALDLEGLRLWDGTVTYHSPKQAQREFDDVASDTTWLQTRLAQVADAGAPDASPATDASGRDAASRDAAADPVLARLIADPKAAARVARQRRGVARLRAVKALQARLLCEGLLTAKSRQVEGMFDLPTHQALAEWERKNDIFGWGFLGGETLAELQRPPAELHLATFKRILHERMADAAAVIEDGSVITKKRPPSYKDQDGNVHPVRNLLGEHVDALLGQLRIATGDDLGRFGRAFGPAGLARLHVAFKAPALPPYYGPQMALEVEIDRGDVWYDFPYDAQGKPIVQKRERYPALTVFVRWNEQRIPLARWRTTIGSWRSELHADGKVYYKYKNSDVGPRIWKYVVAAPVWIPPDGTPARDLLTKKVFDPKAGPVEVVNTEVMGPGFQSAYGLVLAIHHKVTSGGGLFDNQIRTHGSVDYTSIARRFSHGCHRLVNARAVRLFGFVLRHRAFARQGDNVLRIKKLFEVQDPPPAPGEPVPPEGIRKYGYELTTRGYYYELKPPLPVEVLEGRVMGAVKQAITSYVRKPGVDYGPPGETDENVIDIAPALGP
jgi:hypothetical protein